MLQRRNFTGINPVTEQRNTIDDLTIFAERKVVDMGVDPTESLVNSGQCPAV